MDLARFVLTLCAVSGIAYAQEYESLPNLQPQSNVSSATNVLASTSDGGSLSWSNFNYSAGNAAALPGPDEYSSGLDKGQVAGIVIGCVLGGLLIGALSMLCWVKRRRLFPNSFGPPKHPGEAGPIHSIDVLRTGTKLDKLNKEELVSPKSFMQGNQPARDVMTSDRIV